MRLKNKREELEKEKLELELSIDLSLAMVYDNRFKTSIALKNDSGENHKEIVDSYTYNEEFFKDVIFKKMCRVYKINSQIEFLRNASLGID